MHMYFTYRTNYSGERGIYENTVARDGQSIFDTILFRGCAFYVALKENGECNKFLRAASDVPREAAVVLPLSIARPYDCSRASRDRYIFPTICRKRR